MVGNRCQWSLIRGLFRPQQMSDIILRSLLMNTFRWHMWRETTYRLSRSHPVLKMQLKTEQISRNFCPQNRTESKSLIEESLKERKMCEMFAKPTEKPLQLLIHINTWNVCDSETNTRIDGHLVFEYSNTYIKLFVNKFSNYWIEMWTKEMKSIGIWEFGWLRGQLFLLNRTVLNG